MGCYVNPTGASKEEFLMREGRRVDFAEAKITETELPVCLMANGFFTAAGVAFSESELDAFSDPADVRPKAWFMVSKAKLRKVSDLESYE
jgi:hypothetical protein